MKENEQENEKRETVADIVAEMRMGNAGDFPFAYMIGDPDTPEVIDFTTKKVVEPRKINIRRVTVSNLADRLEAAVKRERATCGNAAAMREALVLCSRIIGANGIRSNVFIDDIQEAHKAITDALAAPPRQCDVGTEEEQVKRYDKFCDIHDCRSDCPLFKADSCELAWAQMPYEAEEGAGK